MSESKNDADFYEETARPPIREDYEERYWSEKLEGPSSQSRDVIKASRLRMKEGKNPVRSDT